MTIGTITPVSGPTANGSAPEGNILIGHYLQEWSSVIRLTLLYKLQKLIRRCAFRIVFY